MGNRAKFLFEHYGQKLPIPDAPDKLPATETELNQLVYQTYGLDEDDIRVTDGHLSGAAAGSDEDNIDEMGEDEG